VLAFFEKAGYAVWHLQGDGAPPEVIAKRIQDLIAGEFKERGVA
jgi:hypothetical protein